MFLLIHDELEGPEIKCSFYKNPVKLKKDFISKLYFSHVGINSSAHIEIKFENYRSISCFTGNLDRRSQKEGILCIIFDENEDCNNLDLFLQRNLYLIIDNPDKETMQDIFTNKLPNYLELIKFFEKIEIESIPELYLTNGNSEFKYNLLKIGESNISIPEMASLYQKIIKRQKIPQYYHKELNIRGSNKTHLVLKSDKPTKTIKMLITTIISYLEINYYFSLEILALLFIPSNINIVPVKSEFVKQQTAKSKSFLQILQRSKNYLEEFDAVISKLIEGNIYLSPFL